MIAGNATYPMKSSVRMLAAPRRLAIRANKTLSHNRDIMEAGGLKSKAYGTNAGDNCMLKKLQTSFHVNIWK